MRTNRSDYMATPAGSARAISQKPRPRKPKREVPQLYLLVFFILLPVLLLISFFFQPLRWVFIVASLLMLAAMWLARAFLFPGRMILSAVYGLLSVAVLISALTSRQAAPPAFGVDGFVTPAPQATTTPIFSASYSTMGTDVPSEYYTHEEDIDGLFSDVGETGIQGGSAEDAVQPEEGGEEDTSSTGVYVPTAKSESEIALENFMERWRKGIIADMVEYTAPSWRNAQSDPPQQQLFWKFAQRSLVDWRQMSAPSGTDSSTARTTTIQVDVNYGGELRTYEYDAITLNENGQWFVDPDSLSSGILKEAATPTPDPNLTPTPSPEPTPTPTPGPKTVLYYNKDGGKKYHIDASCSSVASRYLPLKGTFKYGDINKSPYNKLKPCEVCGAPSK